MIALPGHDMGGTFALCVLAGLVLALLGYAVGVFK